MRIAIFRIRCRFPDAVGFLSFLQRSKQRVFEDQAFPSKISEALQSSQKINPSILKQVVAAIETITIAIIAVVIFIINMCIYIYVCVYVYIYIYQ